MLIIFAWKITLEFELTFDRNLLSMWEREKEKKNRESSRESSLFRWTITDSRVDLEPNKIRELASLVRTFQTVLQALFNLSSFLSHSIHCLSLSSYPSLPTSLSLHSLSLPIPLFGVLPFCNGESMPCCQVATSHRSPVLALKCTQFDFAASVSSFWWGSPFSLFLFSFSFSFSLSFWRWGSHSDQLEERKARALYFSLCIV